MRRARAILLVLAFASASIETTRANQPVERIALSGDPKTPSNFVPIRRPNAGEGHRNGTSSSGGWWFSMAGIVGSLALLGGGSFAVKRWKLVPGRDNGSLEIVGRTFLTPKQAVYLVRAGSRTLLIGTGPQGAPSFLGELSDEPAPPIVPGGTR